MDNLTHTATGLFLARTGMNRVTPGATAILMLAANAPDIDVVSAAGGWVNYLHYHRHLTHSLIAMPLMAIMPVLIVRAFGQKVRWLPAFAISMAAVASHLLLDWTNVYGIRLLLPFSGEWFRLDTTSVVDLWIWAMFIIALAAPALSRLVGSEIKSRDERSRSHGRGWAIAALCFLLIYGSGRAALHSRAVGMLDARAYRGSDPVRSAAFPDPVNPLRWRGLVETGQAYALLDFSVTADVQPDEAEFLHKPSMSPAIAAVRGSPAFREFIRFSQFPLWRVRPAPEVEGDELVQLLDLRFGTPQEPGFAATAWLDPQGRVQRSTFQFGRIRPR
jgi:inner membrane protein